MPAHPVDVRVRRSRTALETALRELVAERDLAQLSVSDITRRAGVTRSTFYEHYSDVHELAAAACTSMFDGLVAATPAAGRDLPRDGRSPDSPLPKLFAHVAEHAALYRAVIGRDGSARVINHLLQRIAIAVHVSRGPAEAVPPTHADDPAVIPHDPAAAFVAGALLGIVLDWLHHDCPGTPEQLGATVWPQLLAGTAAAGVPGGLDPDRRTGTAPTPVV
ncbi:TetR/AcrR family transcriptional regulator [Streptomyces sp. NPDC056672]|uniref:TetR/AcrR family transcriptional regulator n=1 Tax=Streptomyces sp. NPDC056672 TaxID=3345906 RepID=UPI00369DC7AA